MDILKIVRYIYWQFISYGFFLLFCFFLKIHNTVFFRYLVNRDRTFIIMKSSCTSGSEFQIFHIENTPPLQYGWTKRWPCWRNGTFSFYKREICGRYISGILLQASYTDSVICLCFRTTLFSVHKVSLVSAAPSFCLYSTRD